MPYLTAMSLCLWALTERLARHQAEQELLWIMKMKFVEERRKQGNLLLKEKLNTTNGDYEHRGERGVVERLGVIFRRTQDQSNVESYPVPFHPSSLLQWFSVPGCLSSPWSALEATLYHRELMVIIAHECSAGFRESFLTISMHQCFSNAWFS